MGDRKTTPLAIDQIHTFWDEVEEGLRSRHHLPANRAIRAILRYRNEIERVGSIIYHREPSDVADDIVSGDYAQTSRQVG